MRYVDSLEILEYVPQDLLNEETGMHAGLAQERVYVFALSDNSGAQEHSYCSVGWKTPLDAVTSTAADTQCRYRGLTKTL